MKYRIEYCPNPNVVLIHVDQRLIRGTILYITALRFDSAIRDIEKEAIDREGLTNFCGVVGELDGMEEHISFYRYNAQISKADMFSWDAILPHVLDALRTFVAHDHELEELRPPTRPTTAELASLAEQARAISPSGDIYLG